MTPADQPITLGALAVLDTVGATRARTTSDPSDHSDHSAAGEEWEPFVPLTPARLLPPFPLDVLAPWVRDMAAEVTTALQVPPDLPGTLALACLAVAAGGRVDVAPVPGWVEPTNLYTVVALAPGSRKSSTFSAMTRPLADAEQVLCETTAAARAEAAILARRARAQAEQAAARAERADADADAVIADALAAAATAREHSDPVEPRLLADDLTPETCATLLAQHDGRLALLSAEGGAFATIAGARYSAAANLEPLLKAHAGDAMRVDRKGRPSERVDAPALTIAITTQPGNLADIAATPGARDRGLLARFLYSLPTNTVGRRAINPPPVTDTTRTAYAHQLAGLVLHLAGLPERVALACDADAIHALTDLQEWLEPRLDPDTGALATVTDWASKMAGVAVRIAGLLHLATHATHPDQGITQPITGPTMHDAITLARYYLAHALTVFDTITTDPAHDGARRILDWITHREDPAAPFTRRDLLRAVASQRFRTVADLTDPLDLLTEHGYLREHTTRPTGGGRPSTTYEVHPDITP